MTQSADEPDDTSDRLYTPEELRAFAAAEADRSEASTPPAAAPPAVPPAAPPAVPAATSSFGADPLSDPLADRLQALLPVIL